MTKLLKVGVMPGRITEITVEEGTTVAQALDIAGLTSEGFEIKMDGTTVTDSAVVNNANVVLLTKKVKGNSGLLKVGVMPGRITEIAIEDGTTVQEALNIADLSADGFEVKLDGSTITDLTQVVRGNVLLLTKKVKGNAGLVKIGVMPGRIQEYALETGVTVQGAIDAADLSVEGFEVKVDGRTVTDLNEALGNANVVLLTKKVKGNNDPEEKEPIGPTL